MPPKTRTPYAYGADDATENAEKRREALKRAQESVQKMRDFKTDSISRPSASSPLNFAAAIPDMARLVRVYGRLTPSVFPELPTDQLEEIADVAESDLELLNSALNFKPRERPRPKRLEEVKQVKWTGSARVYSPESGRMRSAKRGEVMTVDEAIAAFRGDKDGVWAAIANGQLDPMTDETARDKIVARIRGAHSTTFSKLQLPICYGIVSATNVADIDRKMLEANRLMAQIRETAAEQGVFMQADHFKKEADMHEKEAKTWREWVGISVAVFAVFALLSWWWSDAPDTGLALAQSLAGKALVFIALGFGVFFCAKNYMAHRHNAVVNRHRQKALETYRALAEAGGEDSQTRDIVLTHAARCIYAPQDSGYTRGGNSDGGGNPAETIVRPVEAVFRNAEKGDK